VTKIPEVLEFYRLAGDIDYLLKLQVSDIAGYNDVSQKLTRAVHFRDVSGAFAMEEIKNTTAIPLPRIRKPEKPNAGGSKKARTRSRQTRP
jgi:Lrp/AsnC family transcriptional regulator